MSVLRRLLSVGVGLAAGAFAYKLLKDYNDKNELEGDYIELPLEEDRKPEETAAPEWQPRPDNGPLVNPVSLGAAEKPLTEDGKLDPTRIASPEDFCDWDEMGCQS